MVTQLGALIAESNLWTIYIQYIVRTHPAILHKNKKNTVRWMMMMRLDSSAKSKVGLHVPR